MSGSYFYAMEIFLKDELTKNMEICFMEAVPLFYLICPS